jgi:precorrin-6Y C5,15-methyltransferase (decarboxylating)
MKPWLAILGIGEDGLAGLNAAARALIDTAETFVGGERHLGMVPAGPAERLKWQRPLSDTIGSIAARRGSRVVVLASGDPLWYGVGALLARHFPPEEMVILPQPSAFSLAAARLGWTLADCVALSAHGRPLDSLRLHLAPQRRLLLLSEDCSTPRAVARLLTELGWGPSRLAVFEHLGGASEARVREEAQHWGERLSADLNTIAVECIAGPDARPLSRLAGLPDDAFEHDGQLTKREVRAMTLAALGPLPGERMWDIGAGCGSIAIEWLRAIEAGTAIAIERSPDRAAMIARNAVTLGVPGLQIVIGTAPQALARLDAPNAVFIGGGIADPELLSASWDALCPGGRLVANVVSLSGERAILDFQAQYGGSLTRIAVSHAGPLGAQQGWRPQLPVTQLAAAKPR